MLEGMIVGFICIVFLCVRSIKETSAKRKAVQATIDYQKKYFAGEPLCLGMPSAAQVGYYFELDESGTKIYDYSKVGYYDKQRNLWFDVCEMSLDDFWARHRVMKKIFPEVYY